MADNRKRKTAEIINPGLGDIEKIREILFGKYVASFEEQFADIEARLEKDVEELTDKLLAKLETVNKKIETSLNSLEDRFANESDGRDVEFKNLQENLSKSESAMQYSINVLEDQANQEIVEVRRVLEANQEQLMNQLLEAQSKLNKEIETQNSQLESNKVGRQSLALLLDEVAVRLRSNDE